MEGFSYNKDSILEKYDSTPTTGSTKLVNSGNIKNYVDGEIATIDSAMDTLEANVNSVLGRIGNPFTFKGTVVALSNLPSSGNTVNDTYFVTNEGFMYTWNGSSWDKTSTDVNNQLAHDIATEYDGTKSDYKQGQLVLYNNQVYIRKANATGAEGTFVAANWTATSLGDELYNEVTNLKSALKDELTQYKLPYFIIKNEYVGTNGEINSYNNWSRTDYIPIKHVYSITVSTSINSIYNVFYDESYNKVGNSFTINGTEKTIVIPDGVEYVIFSNTNEGMNSLNVKYVSKNKHDLDVETEEITDLKSAIGEIVNYQLYDGYLDAAGQVAQPSSNSEKYTSLIPVSTGQKININISFASEISYWVTIGCYDEEENWIKRETAISGAGSTVTTEFTIDNETKYVSVTFRSKYMNSLRIYFDNNIILRLVSLEEKNNDILTNINQITNRVDNLSVLSNLNLIDETNLLNISDATYTDGFYKFTPSQAHTKYRNESFPHRAFKENTQYTITGLFKTEGNEGTDTLYIILQHTDGTGVSIVIPGAVGVATRYSLTSTFGKTVSSINLSYSRSPYVYVKDFMMVEGTTIPNEFIPYDDYTACDDVSRKGNEKNNSIINNYIIDTDSQNLFCKRTSEVGHLDASGDVIGLIYNVTSDYIAIPEEKTNITMQTLMVLPEGVTHWQAICFYDSSKALLGSRNAIAGSVDYRAIYTVSIPTGAKYVRISSRAYGDWKIMCQWGDIPTAYVLNQTDIETLPKIKADDTFVKSINHRGWTFAPENTLPAYRLSKLNGFNYVECDVEKTSDGVFVLLHDATINRTARNSDGTSISSTINIENITYEQALNYDFGIYRGVTFKGTKIPTLSQFLSLCKKISLKPYIEIKNSVSFTTPEIQSIIDLIRTYDMVKDTTIISFSGTYLNAVVAYEPNIRVGIVCNEVTSDVVQYAETLATTNSVFIDSHSYTHEEINLCKNANIPLEVWTLDDATSIVACDGYISGVTSNILIASNVLYNSEF